MPKMKTTPPLNDAAHTRRGKLDVVSTPLTSGEFRSLTMALLQRSRPASEKELLDFHQNPTF